MQSRLRIANVTLFIIMLLVFAGCGQQNSAAAPTSTPTQPPTPTPVLPVQYAATASSPSWSFTFLVDPAGTYVSSLSADFPAEFQCGGFVIDIPTGGKFPGPWSVTNGQFIIKEDIEVLGSLTISGAITQATKAATGTWMIANSTFGTSCNGTWTATGK